MSFKNLLISALAVMALASCSKSSENNNSAAPGIANAAPALAADNNYAAGSPAYVFSVEKGPMTIDGAAVDSVDNSVFEGYPTLASNVEELNSISKAVETREQHLELWVGEEFILAADLRAESPSLVFSKSGMTVERIAFSKAASEQGQGLSTGTVTVDLRECMVPQEEDKGQGQDQDQEKGEDQSKDQGQQGVMGSDDIAKGEDKGQDQDKGEEVKAPSCKLVSYTMNLTEIEQAKDEDQGKDQDQAKGEDQSKGQDQGKI